MGVRLRHRIFKPLSTLLTSLAYQMSVIPLWRAINLKKAKFGLPHVAERMLHSRRDEDYVVRDEPVLHALNHQEAPSLQYPVEVLCPVVATPHH